MTKQKAILISDRDIAPDGVYKLNRCSECDMFDSVNSKCRFNGKKVKDETKIPGHCNLIDSDLLRWHGMDERPPEGERVNIEVMLDVKQIRTGHIVKDSMTWVIDGFGFVYGSERNIELLRWRYIL